MSKDKERNLRHRAIECLDHLGNKYISKKAMAEHYEIPYQVFRHRIKEGWTLEQSLTLPVGHRLISTQVKDHIGNVYETKSAMLNHYSIENGMYNDRIRKGWSQADALTTAPSKGDYTQSIKCVDHLGNVFDSKSARAAHYKLQAGMIEKRLKLGWSLKDALTIRPNGRPLGNDCVDHLGNKYVSEAERARAYKVLYHIVQRRLSQNWSLERALTTPYNADGDIVIKTGHKECKDHLNNVFTSKAKRAEHYGLDVGTVNTRLKRGWTLKRALTTPPHGSTA